MKVISVNAGYFLGYDGTHKDYLRHPLKSLTGSENEKDYLEGLVEIIRSIDPDIVLVQEIDGGSFRSNFNGQLDFIEQMISDEFSTGFSCKYRGSLFPKLPLFRKMGNAVIYKQGKLREHRLSSGRKNLVQEIVLPDLSIFSVHLSTFGGWIRRKQFNQLNRLLNKRGSQVLAGDFNIHKGKKELDKLVDITGDVAYSSGKTFPAGEPHQELDLVISSEDVRVKNLENLGNRFSDHRPLVFELEKQ